MKQRKTKTDSRKLLVVFLFSIILVGIAGVVDGLITHRWVPSTELRDATEAIEQLPMKIGDWEAQEQEIPPEVLAIAEATGYVKRTYTNRKRPNEWISVTLLCGPHGPISLHPPTVCFTGAGWGLKEGQREKKYELSGGDICRTWQAEFERRVEANTQSILTDWSWNDGSGWSASSNPRYDYAGSPFLFKLYITSDSNSKDDPEAHTRREKFVKSLCSEIEQSVFNSISSTVYKDDSTGQ